MNPKKEKITPSQNALCADRLDALRVAGDAAQVCGERCGAGCACRRLDKNGGCVQSANRLLLRNSRSTGVILGLEVPSIYGWWGVDIRRLG